MKNTIAQEIGAEVQLTMPERVAAVLSRNRLVEGFVSTLREGGLVKSIPASVQRDLKTTGIGTAIRSMPAFSGVLYGITSLAVRSTMSGKTVLSNDHISRVETGDCDFLGLDDRLRWKAYVNLYSLITELLRQNEAEWPEAILVDMPLFITRSQMLQSVEECDEILQEWDDLEHFVRAFWETDGKKLFPFNPSGPRLVSVIPKLNGTMFRGLREHGADVATDEVSDQAMRLIVDKETQLKQAGSGRIIDRLLRPQERTIGFSLSSILSDTRTQPKRIFERGVCAYLMRAGSRTRVWMVEVVGSVDDWKDDRLDALSDLIANTCPYNNPDALPIALFTARRNVVFPQSVLEYMKQVIVKSYRET